MCIRIIFCLILCFFVRTIYAGPDEDLAAVKAELNSRLAEVAEIRKQIQEQPDLLFFRRNIRKALSKIEGVPTNDKLANLLDEFDSNIALNSTIPILDVFLLRLVANMDEFPQLVIEIKQLHKNIRYKNLLAKASVVVLVKVATLQLQILLYEKKLSGASANVLSFANLTKRIWDQLYTNFQKNPNHPPNNEFLKSYEIVCAKVERLNTDYKATDLEALIKRNKNLLALLTASDL